MPYSGLAEFVNKLESLGEVQRINTFVDPELEITEITDRITKSGGKALLFENNGSRFPLLINSFGSDRRMAMAMGISDIEEAGREIEILLGYFDSIHQPWKFITKNFRRLLNLRSILPKKRKGRGKCQQVVINDPDLSILPVLKCWPYDGGKFITLPLVHTINADTGKKNLGMYRMQILDDKSTGMHWHRHKTGATHFESWKKKGKPMPVTVTLGGDPVYTYAATAPLPENIDEYMLAGFLRGKRVELVKCLTNELFVPADADIVIEGFVDPSDDLIWEGPFGDHTGFYSLADWYPRFRVTCITHRSNAIYPATIVGVPPQEDYWLGKATEKLFLKPLKLTMMPEIIDLHLPAAGVAHNLVLVKITKKYPGQGQKILSSLFGAGQMMFSKYIVVVSSDVDLEDYNSLIREIVVNTDPAFDFMMTSGPMDVLDHASDVESYGGKLGIDATVKTLEELKGRKISYYSNDISDFALPSDSAYSHIKFNSTLIDLGIPVIILSGLTEELKEVEKIISELRRKVVFEGRFLLFAIVDKEVDIYDSFTVMWQLLGNTDPRRDIVVCAEGEVIVDARIKAGHSHFSRDWPNVVASLPSTIEKIDQIWGETGLGNFVKSPSKKYGALTHGESATVSYGRGEA